MGIEELVFFPFNSDRKRASIIVRHEGKIKIMMKGADSYIIARLAP
jgi:magnesium-transporting ATPase (P-type)